MDTWRIRRESVLKEYSYNDGASTRSLREFVELQDALTRRMISLLQEQEPEWYTALYELAQNTDKIIRGGKTFINGQQVRT